MTGPPPARFYAVRGGGPVPAEGQGGGQVPGTAPGFFGRESRGIEYPLAILFRLG